MRRSIGQTATWIGGKECAVLYVRRASERGIDVQYMRVLCGNSETHGRLVSRLMEVKRRFFLFFSRGRSRNNG